MASGDAATDDAFFESKVRPLLVKHCYECHLGRDFRLADVYGEVVKEILA